MECLQDGMVEKWVRHGSPRSASDEAKVRIIFRPTLACGGMCNTEAEDSKRKHAVGASAAGPS